MKLKVSSLILVGTLMLALTACGGNQQSATTTDTQTSVETPVESTEEVALTGVKVEPLPNTTSLDTLDNSSFAVSFTGKDVSLDDGILNVNLNVYRNEYFDMIDIGALAVGDIIVINGNEVVVAQIDKGESRVIINGGLTEGGYDLDTDNVGGVYYDAIMDIGARRIPVGEVTLRVNQDFEFIDNSDLDNVGVVYLAGDFIQKFMGTDEAFSEYATTAQMQDGQLVGLVRNYMP